MALTAMLLRVEEPDGRTVAEYRIRDEAIEVRHLPFSTGNEDEWYRLTAEDLTSHISRNTAVAQWLTRRLGWRRLLRACVGEQSLHHFDIVDSPTDRRVA